MDQNKNGTPLSNWFIFLTELKRFMTMMYVVLCSEGSSTSFLYSENIYKFDSNISIELCAFV